MLYNNTFVEAFKIYIKMKKLIVLFSVIAFAVCPFTPSTGNDRIPSSDGVEEIIFHISGEAGDIVF